MCAAPKRFPPYSLPRIYIYEANSNFRDLFYHSKVNEKLLIDLKNMVCAVSTVNYDMY